MNIILISDIVLLVLALTALAIASYTDFKRREVANWLPFSLIIVAIIIRTMASILSSENFANIFLSLGLLLVFLLGFFFLLKNQRPWLEYAVAISFFVVWWFARRFNLDYLSGVFLIFGIFIILSNIMYYTKISGGADAKILLALAVVFSSTPVFLNQSYNLYIPIFSSFVFSSSPFIFDFFVNSLFVGFVFGLVFSIASAFKNKKPFQKSLKKNNQRFFVFKLVFLIVGVIFFILSFFEDNLLLLAIFLFITPYLIVFVYAVQESCMTKLKSWEELTEGDWLAKNVRIGNKVLKKTADGLTKNDISLIKKSGKRVPVLDGMPFVPVFLISVIICLIFGNLLFKLLEIMV